MIEKSTYISSVSFMDPASGSICLLDVHQIPGGYIGIDPSFIENVGNYIVNPFEETNFVLLTDNEGTDDAALEPPIEEDDIFGFMLLVDSFRSVFENKEIISEELRNSILKQISEKSGLTEDRVEVLMGLARNSVENREIENGRDCW
jgi:hypothetical protein